MKSFRLFQVLICSLLFVNFMVVGCRKAPSAPPTFDVPSLIGKRFEDAQKKLGAPSQNGAWTRDDIMLQIQASQRGRITGINIHPKEPLREGEKKEFLRQLTLTEGDSRYSLEWLENSDDVQKSDGVQVIPTSKSYTVTLRLTGSTNMVWVKYSPASADAPGRGESLTIPPWEAQITAQSGTIIALEAGFPRLSDTGELTLQIEANGKVEAKQTISAGSTKIETELL